MVHKLYKSCVFPSACLWFQSHLFCWLASIVLMCSTSNIIGAGYVLLELYLVSIFFGSNKIDIQTKHCQALFNLFLLPHQVHYCTDSTSTKEIHNMYVGPLIKQVYLQPNWSCSVQHICNIDTSEMFIEISKRPIYAIKCAYEAL